MSDDAIPSRILGIDPGTRTVGWGLVEHQGGHFEALAHGTIQPDKKLAVIDRLRLIFEEIGEVMSLHEPEVVVIESVYFGRNVQSAMRIAEGRTTCLLAASVRDIPIETYTAPEIKRAVTGNGRAPKAQVQEMVKLLLKLDEVPQPDDAADALAAAICHCHRLPLARRPRNPRSRTGKVRYKKD